LIMVAVKLYDTLPGYVVGYDSQSGITAQVEEGTTYEDLFGTLRLSPEEARLIIVQRVSRKARDTIGDYEDRSFFVPIAGG